MVFFIFCMLYLQWIPGYGLVPCQVWKFQTLMSKPLDPVAIHHDAWGVKKLFSYSLRRTGVTAATLWMMAPPIAEFLCCLITDGGESC